MILTRRAFTSATFGAAGLAALGERAFAAIAAPKSPVTLNVIDVAGNLPLTQPAIDAYDKGESEASFRPSTFTQAPAPELPGKIKAQQDAGPGRHRPGADRHRRAVRRHRAELWIRASPDYADDAARPDAIYLPAAAKMQRSRAGPGRRAWCSARPGPIIEYMPDAVKTPPKTARRAAGLGEGQPEPLHLRAPRQFRPRPHLPEGPALHPRRQGPDGSEGRLGQDLGLSQGAGQEHRILPDRHRRGDEGARRGLARHDRLAHRLGHQPAHPRRRAEGGEGRHAGRLPLGRPTRSTCASRRASTTTSSPCCSS